MIFGLSLVWWWGSGPWIVFAGVCVGGLFLAGWVMSDAQDRAYKRANVKAGRAPLAPPVDTRESLCKLRQQGELTWDEWNARCEAIGQSNTQLGYLNPKELAESWGDFGQAATTFEPARRINGALDNLPPPPLSTLPPPPNVNKG